MVRCPRADDAGHMGYVGFNGLSVKAKEMHCIEGYRCISGTEMIRE